MCSSAPPTTLACGIGLLLLPEALYYATLFVLVLRYGGHRSAYIGTNPRCAAPQNATAPSTGPHVILHITDLHATTAHGRWLERVEKLERDVVGVWAPALSAVVISGDLVHAEAPRVPWLGTRSRQDADEWSAVEEVLQRLNESVPVISCHGNHDTFGSALQHSELATSHLKLAAAASADGGVRVLRAAHGLSIVALDATLERPKHRPFNFFGDARRVTRALNSTLHSLGDDNIVAFSHYPAGVMAGGKAIRELGAKAPTPFVAHLSGHLHNLHGLAPHGLSVATRSGPLELETPDMTNAGGYRLLAIDGGLPSTTVSFVTASSFLHDALVLTPPRVALCPPGAGYQAFNSSHIRVISPRVDLEAENVIAYIGGTKVSAFRRLNGICAACAHLYGAPWKAALYKRGVHELMFVRGETRSSPYRFSLDGSVNSGSKDMVDAFVSSFFALSDFESIINALSTSVLALCIALCVPGVAQRRKACVVLFGVASSWLLGAPLLVGQRLVAEGESAVCTLSLGRIWVAGMGRWDAGIDAGFLFSRGVLWSVLLQLCFVQAVIQLRCANGPRFRNLLFGAGAFYFWRALGSMRELLGAYGLLASVASPACFPLVALTLWCMRIAVVDCTPSAKRKS